MKKILNHLFEHKTLTQQMAKDVLVNIAKGMYNESEIASFITVYLMRSITIDELQGFRDALLELCVTVDLNEYETMDIVGTGGDGKNQDPKRVHRTHPFVSRTWELQGACL